jgi:hypothetical protein
MRLFPCLVLASLASSLPGRAWAEECMSAAKSSEIAAKLAEGEAALARADADGFQFALEEVTLLLPCLGDTLPTPTAAQLHRLTGIQSWGAGNAEAAKEAFRAARVLDPTYHFPESLFAAQHDVRAAYESIASTDYRDKAAPEPKNGLVAFDGRISKLRPADRTTVMQLLTVSQQVAQTNYLRPEQPLPLYPAIPKTRNALIVTTIASAITAGALYGAAWATRDAFDHENADYTLADLQSFRTQTDVLLVGSAAFSAVTLGTGVGIFVVGEK